MNADFKTDHYFHWGTRLCLSCNLSEESVEFRPTCPRPQAGPTAYSPELLPPLPTPPILTREELLERH